MLYHEVWGVPPGCTEPEMVAEFDQFHWQFAEKCRKLLLDKRFRRVTVVDVEHDPPEDSDGAAEAGGPGEQPRG